MTPRAPAETQGGLHAQAGERSRIGPVAALALVLAVPAILHGESWNGLTTGGPDAHTLPSTRLPGEFEPQGALLLSGPELIRTRPELLARIAAAVRDELTVLVMVNDPEEADQGRDILRRIGIPNGRVPFLSIPSDTLWVRDYGPFVTYRNGFVTIVDPWYGHEGRPIDEEVPTRFARLRGLPVVPCPLVIEGGNLLSNGTGLCVTTTRLIAQNAAVCLAEENIRTRLRRHLGVSRLVVLEPLDNEQTGHVDMFAAFTAPDTIVVGSYAAEVDPINAAILNRNAARLAAVRTTHGPLRVVRIPMPSRRGGRWRTYTNLLFANRAVLVPVYPGVDAEAEARALHVLGGLLPGRRLVSIDAESLVELEGALHCVAMNLGPLECRPVVGVRTESPWNDSGFGDGAGKTGSASRDLMAPRSTQRGRPSLHFVLDPEAGTFSEWQVDPPLNPSRTRKEVPAGTEG
jgi:agmatine/peptidylarginine deiminase